jgi:hypothetical protein
MKYKYIAMAIGILALGTFLSPAFAAFSDVSSDTATRTYINDLESRGIVEGYYDGTFKPENWVNRAEFLKVLMKASGHETDTVQRCLGGDGTTRCMPTVNCFKDFTGARPEWFWEFACSAKAAGIIDGYPDGTFGGNQWVNVAEAVKMTVDAFGVPLPQYFRAPDHWYDPYMDAAASTTAFDIVPRIPENALKRGEMAALIGAFITMEGKSCFSSDDCGTDQYCSTENGDCFSSCKPGAEACIQACSGFCKAQETMLK